MKVRDKILHKLSSSIPLCDDCLAESMGFNNRQQANQYCNNLHSDKLISRTKSYCSNCNSHNKFVNFKL